MTKQNKFEVLTREELVLACLELEDELARLRPKPPKYKMGQVLAFGIKHPMWVGQPTVFFTVLSVEHRNGKWLYGYAANVGPGGTFQTYPEDRLRPLTPTEIDGTQPAATLATPAAMEASTVTAPNTAPNTGYAATPDILL